MTIAFLSAVILSIMDIYNDYNISKRSIVGKLMVYSCILMISSSIIMMIISMANLIYYNFINNYSKKI